jgi:hypothetical protein
VPGSNGTVNPRWALPGAQPHSLLSSNNPTSVPTLMENVMANTQWVLSAMRARVAELAPAAPDTRQS